jgi:hypothetical protein
MLKNYLKIALRNKLYLFINIAMLLLLSIGGYAQKNKKAEITNLPNSNLILPLNPENWDFQAGKVAFLEYKGVKAIKLDEKSGPMYFKDLIFKNGTIEFDVEVNQAYPFPTIYFRKDKENSEHVYLRTGVVNQKNAIDAVQYASIVKSANMWDLQHEYQSAANMKIGDWNHIKLVVSGKQLRVFINNPIEPNLEIPCMEGITDEGQIGIETGFPGQAIFANIIVKPNETEGLSPQAGADITKHDTRYIRNWLVSKPDSLPNGKELNTSMLPKNIAWENITAERRGLVNLSKKYGNNPKRNYVWLRAKIKSETDQSQLFKLGFSDDVWVFVNQKPVYLDKNDYMKGMLKSPNGRISLDNCAFQIHLQKGENELLIGLANDFYGWGIMARLENIEGIELE